MPVLHTTLGALDCAPSSELILPHEHIFVDLRTLDAPGYGQAAGRTWWALMAPELERARAAGVTALVECTPEGVGRRVDLVEAVSRAAEFPVVVATGIYREPWVPAWAHAASEDILQGWMLGELEVGIGADGRAGGLHQAQRRRRRADPGRNEDPARGGARRAGRRARRSAATPSAGGWCATSWTSSSSGLPRARFICIHAQAEPDFELNLEVARRGAWIYYDGIGWGDDDELYIRRIQAMLEAGFGGQVMLSMDRGWYDPAEPGGGNAQAVHLPERDLPAQTARRRRGRGHHSPADRRESLPGLCAGNKYVFMMYRSGMRPSDTYKILNLHVNPLRPRRHPPLEHAGPARRAVGASCRLSCCWAWR